MVDYTIEKIDANDINRIAIAKYLSERTFADSALEEACKKENKSLDGVMKYIMDEARKLAFHGCAMVEDATVYDWAVHYILEDSIDCEKKEPEPTSFDKLKENHPTPIFQPKTETPPMQLEFAF